MQKFLATGVLAAGVMSCASQRNVCVPDYVATVALMRDGSNLLNGVPVSAEELSGQLDGLNVRGVWLYRQRSIGAAIAVKRAQDAIVDAVYERDLAVMWSTRPDFSNYVGLESGRVYSRSEECPSPVRSGDYIIYQF